MGGEFYAKIVSIMIDKAKKRRILKNRVKHIKVDSKTTVADLVSAMADMSIQARNIGQCAQVLKNMYQDKKRPTVLLGLAGPLIAAGLRRVIRDLIVNKAVDVVVSTGAIIYQDVYAALGHGHYLGSIDADDPTLRDLKIDRIYDTYIDEEKVFQAEPIWNTWLMRLMMKSQFYGSVVSMGCRFFVQP